MKNRKLNRLVAAIFFSFLPALASASALPPPPLAELPHGNGCNGTCLNPLLLPVPAGVVDGVAYFGGYYLGCDEDRPANQQLAWHSPTLSYYFPPARICASAAPAPTTIPLPVVPDP